MIAVNGRFLLRKRITGVERYAHELLARLPEYGPLRVERPRSAQSAYQHLWEQAILPARLARDTVLFNPCNLAPLAHPANVITLHDVVPLVYPQFYRPAFQLYYRTLIPLLARRALHILTVSEFSRRQILAGTGVDEKKVTVVPNGVSERFVPSLRSASSAIRTRYGIGAPYLLYVGSLEPRKNVATLLKAFSYAQRHLGLRGYELLIAGDRHRNFADVDVAPDQTAGIRLLGYVADADLPALYANADLFVYPSLCEGFGLPVLEAMACGVVALAAAGSSLIEVVGDAELCFDALDHRALAEKICFYLARPGLRQDCIARGLQRVEQFRWSRSAMLTARVLTDFR
ncbi:glycosyltransferase family 4 protein [Gloeobacter kilaueensis]|uniref:Glycosyl transferase group 1 n=1 Tax=Gloeobacter kilaueensis (strain ATCC BAA-2537 / CCAP 1431/1 / ULC 316 / JS1) TaxID=1183438 RepID=U5QGN4_GLOK1|nr:glycosyltransferase family 1 protein [Gloeobacter kilaueensis]AGY58096.1 glycosyl transferase group 1 [Gloeobacter kilaueensis JS1]